jgi:hypothetical protein
VKQLLPRADGCSERIEVVVQLARRDRVEQHPFGREL